jgi:prepilin-type N-terminal cleavage/methylation domain-containing protein
MGQRGTCQLGQHMNKTRKVAARIAGFTLIELLVVCSILVTLAGMLVPSFAAARRCAILASCGSNMHAVGIALRQYASLND